MALLKKLVSSAVSQSGNISNEGEGIETSK